MRLSRGFFVSNASRYDAACLYAVAAGAVAAETNRPLPQREKTAEGYARRAVELLRRAHRAGYFRDANNASHLGKDDDLAFLRPRPDFQALLKEVTVQAGASIDPARKK